MHLDNFDAVVLHILRKVKILLLQIMIMNGSLTNDLLLILITINFVPENVEGRTTYCPAFEESFAATASANPWYWSALIWF